MPVEAPESLIGQEVEQRLHDLMHRIQQQGMTIPEWLAATGQDQNEFIEQIREGARKAVLADLALRAVVTHEEISASDDEVDAEIERLAQQNGEKPQKLRRDLDRRGLLEAVRFDIARGKALQFVIEAAVALDSEGNEVDVEIPAPEPTAVTELETPEVETTKTEEESEA